MDHAFTHLGNHLISDSTRTIGDDLDGSILDGNFASLGNRRRRQDDEDTDVFDDNESIISGMNGKQAQQEEEEPVELPPHACAYVKGHLNSQDLS
jgi:regulator of nonsense transcripts 1